MSIRQDHARFRDIVRGKIKENFKKYITHGEMIGKRDDKFVRIPIPHIDIPRFKYGPRQSGGVGQGPGNPGDPVAGDPQDGDGKAGDQPGEHTLEVDISFEELADILGEGLELPRIKPKGNKQVENIKVKYTGIAPIGPETLRHFKASFKEALKRAISSGIYDPENPYVAPVKKDMRYRTYKKIIEPKTNAVVIYMMDVSGSMGEEQKEIVRLESFWINTWLKKHYPGLQTRFIIHDVAAREVDEKTFFTVSEAGGTLISSAYALCNQMIEEEYPIDEWNIYPFHFSDGDNWSSDDTRVCVGLLKDNILKKVNMFGYGQVESKYGSGQFLKDLEKEFKEDEILVMSRIENRDKIVDSIKDF